MRDTERERERERERQRHRQREKQAPCREPDAGLDPEFSRIAPWAKGRCSTAEPPGLPPASFFNSCVIVLHLFTLPGCK